MTDRGEAPRCGRPSTATAAHRLSRPPGRRRVHSDPGSRGAAARAGGRSHRRTAAPSARVASACGQRLLPSVCRQSPPMATGEVSTRAPPVQLAAPPGHGAAEAARHHRRSGWVDVVGKRRDSRPALSSAAEHAHVHVLAKGRLAAVSAHTRLSTAHACPPPTLAATRSRFGPLVRFAEAPPSQPFAGCVRAASGPLDDNSASGPLDNSASGPLDTQPRRRHHKPFLRASTPYAFCAGERYCTKQPRNTYVIPHPHPPTQCRCGRRSESCMSPPWPGRAVCAGRRVFWCAPPRLSRGH